MLRPLFLSFALCGPLALSGCVSPPSGLDLSLDRPTAQHKYRVAMRPLVDTLPINKMHAWEILLRTPAGASVPGAKIAVGGGMPQHGHGFPTQPRVTRDLGDGRYLVEGMKFSMPGWWEISLTVEAAPGTDNVVLNTIVAPLALPPMAAAGAAAH